MSNNPKQSINEILQNKNNYFVVQWDNSDLFICSPSFEELLGYSSNEISKLPNKHHSLLSENQDEVIHDLIDQKNNLIEPKQHDFELVSKDGKHFWFREFISPSTSSNDVGFQSILFNITDFKDEELRLKETIDTKIELSKSKDKLISIISHDLRAPFSSLLGFSEILINEPNLPETERHEYLQYIYDASKIQLQMVNHLLDWTRLQTGTMKFDPQRLDIRDVVDNCVSVLTGSVIRKDLEIKVTGKHKIFVNADERLISQAITNLLSNAVKFTPSGKIITVTIDLFKEDMAEIIILDEGVGIDEENQDKLFRIDSKFSKTGTAGEKGSGFGLPLVKEIIEKHSGKIWFYSELNKGSEFHFTLPKSEDTILILEEHEELREIYTSLVSEKFIDYQILFCKNGFEALNLILDKTPSILITYHKMPLMNGIQLVSSLRKKDIHNKVSVIVLGDEISEKEKREYINLKVKTYLPINSPEEKLSAALEELIHI